MQRHKWTVGPGRLLERDGRVLVSIQIIRAESGERQMEPWEADSLTRRIAFALNRTEVGVEEGECTCRGNGEIWRKDAELGYWLDRCPCRMPAAVWACACGWDGEEPAFKIDPRDGDAYCPECGASLCAG